MAAVRRIRREIKECCDDSWKESSFIMAVPDPEFIFDVRGYIISPSVAPTGNYIFKLRIIFPGEYPFKPPGVYFENKVWHPKIQPEYGSLCFPMLTPDCWKPRMVIKAVGTGLADFLQDPGEVPVGQRPENHDAYQQFTTDLNQYNKVALEWAEKDNSGFGMVWFDDLRLSAIQSCLLVPQLIPYECHIFCQSSTPLKFQLIAIVIPCLKIYREKVEKDYCSTMKRVTISPEFHFIGAEIKIACISEFSRDKCWKISFSDESFEKAKVDKKDPRKDPLSTCLIIISWQRPELEANTFTEKLKISDSDGEIVIRAFDIHIDPGAYRETVAVSCKLGSQLPTLPLLLSLPLSSGKVNLTEVIGARYFDFGVHLLNDETGQLIESIETEHQKIPKNIVRKIFTEWLQGKGKEVTWGVLVDILKSIRLNELAADINKQYK